MSWFWAPLFFIIGAIVGVVITAVIAYDGITLKDMERRFDDEERE